MPANRAWFPAERTDVRMTEFINEPAAPTRKVNMDTEPYISNYLLAPTWLNIIVNGEVVVVLLDSPG